MRIPRKKEINCFECEGVSCNSVETIGVCRYAQKCYTMILFDADGVISGSRGCVNDRDHVPFLCFSQTDAKNEEGVGRYFTECCDESMCNSRMFSTYKNPHPAVKINNQTDVSTLNNFEKQLLNTAEIIGVIIFFIFFLKLLYMYIYVPYLKNKSSNSNSTTSLNNRQEIKTENSKESSSSRNIQIQEDSQSNANEYMREQMNLVNNLMSIITLQNDTVEPQNRTLARQVKIIECLGNGDFGHEIWRGTYNEENVTVKIFTSDKQVSLFYRETKVYTELLTKRHEHVVNFIGNDSVKANCLNFVRHYIVTQYYPLGTLQNFLTGLPKPLTYKQTFDLCLSLSKGLLYLHTEVFGSHGKLSIAHRNLTSKNIMVKANGVCAIGEFGYAVTQKMLESFFIDLEESSVRYASPEILTKKINVKNLADFLCSDVYSVGLIFWEICRCCSISEVALDYAAPYSEWLQPEQKASLQFMQKLVVEDQIRPTIPAAWHYDPILKQLGVMIGECWYEKPASRLTALRIKKTLTKLIKPKSKSKVKVTSL